MLELTIWHKWKGSRRGGWAVSSGCQSVKGTMDGIWGVPDSGSLICGESDQLFEDGKHAIRLLRGFIISSIFHPMFFHKHF